MAMTALSGKICGQTVVLDGEVPERYEGAAVQAYPHGRTGRRNGRG